MRIIECSKKTISNIQLKLRLQSKGCDKFRDRYIVDMNLLGDPEVSTNLYCNSRTSVL